MKVISLIGHPCIVINQSPFVPELSFFSEKITGYYKKGDLLRGFELKNNHFFYNRGDVFRAYGTFENANGVGITGEDKIYVQKGVDDNEMACISNSPFFIGDILNEGQFVTSAISIFDHYLLRWEITFESSDSLPQALYDPSDNVNEYFSKINDSLIAVKDSLDNLRDAFNTTSVGVPVNGWGTPPNSAQWNGKISDSQNDINDAIDQLQEYLL